MRGWAARMRAPHGRGLMKRRDFIAWLAGWRSGRFAVILAAPAPWPSVAAVRRAGPQPLNRPQRPSGQRPRKNIFN
jgi:hypothetical protein